ncbi:hypothetical protein [Chelativorans sp.]|uniref:cell division protein FtsL n=1 Tax=Chelativorans sp. TaxID=2203393 RepID=UPI00281272BC|nr:hypothetical protein [Chelativorans sp.]
MLFRTSDVILITVMLSAAAFTYKTKHDAEAMMDRIKALQTQVQLEKDTIDVLNADWSLLTQPARLQRLAKAYEAELGLKILQPQQIVGYDALGGIPFRVNSVEELIAQNGGLDLENTDFTTTGGVRP